VKVLIYKRTHTGDPDVKGRFGINDCMGTIRNLAFDAVIGVGGTGKEPQAYAIDQKVNWIGINPTRQRGPRGVRADIVTFEKFALFDERGPLLSLLAPNLARRMYAGRRFIFKSISSVEHAEALEILKLAEGFEVTEQKNRITKKIPLYMPGLYKRKRRAKKCA
jgi:hypothetical protein